MAGRGMPAAGRALRLSRLLDRREPEDGLQGPLPGARALTAGRLGRFGPVSGPARNRSSPRAYRGLHLTGARVDAVPRRGANVSLRAVDRRWRSAFSTWRSSPTCSAPRRCARCSASTAFLARCAEVEAALARAQARLGIIPAEAAAAISQAAAAIAEHPETARPRAAQARDRECRLSDPAAGPPARRTGRRGRALAALGCDDAGHHGHRRGAADPRRAGADRGGSRGGARPSRRSRPPLPRHADGRPHPSAARAADHLRLQGRDLAVGARPPRRAPGATAPAGARRRSSAAPPAPWPRSARARTRQQPHRTRARTRPRRPADHLARRPRRHRRDGAGAGVARRQPRPRSPTT